MSFAAGRAIYAYCVVHRVRRPAMSRIPSGLAGASKPELLELSGSLWCVVSEVPLARYGEEQIQAGLRDLEWVADVAVRHEAVVEHLARSSGATIVPMKVFTMFSSRERALEEMRSHRRELTAILKRIRGCHEWGIRVLPVAARLPAATSARRTHVTGAGFLAAKKSVREQTRLAAERAFEAAETAFDILSGIAREARRRDDVPQAAVAVPLVDAAFLVPSSRAARFRQAARRASRACRVAGAELRLSGPWPPYNFVSSPTRDNRAEHGA